HPFRGQVERRVLGQLRDAGQGPDVTLGAAVVVGRLRLTADRVPADHAGRTEVRNGGAHRERRPLLRQLGVLAEHGRLRDRLEQQREVAAGDGLAQSAHRDRRAELRLALEAQELDGLVHLQQTGVGVLADRDATLAVGLGDALELGVRGRLDSVEEGDRAHVSDSSLQEPVAVLSATVLVSPGTGWTTRTMGTPAVVWPTITPNHPSPTELATSVARVVPTATLMPTGVPEPMVSASQPVTGKAKAPVRATEAQPGSRELARLLVCVTVVEPIV